MDNYLIKPAIHGSVTALAGSYLTGLSLQNGFIVINGKQFPSALVYFGVGAINSIITDEIHKALREEIPKKQKFADATSIALGSVTSGIMMPLILSVMNPNLHNMDMVKKMFITGVVAEIASAYIDTLV
jgi:hypothetical protein